MSLPIRPPFLPMEALSADEIPTGTEWHYEPKWDGFRCLVFRDGTELELQSKSAQSLSRYFPELTAALRALKPRNFVLDGEIVVAVDGHISFDELLMRIHPAESRISKLSREHPANLIVFDLLVDAEGRSLISEPLAERRRRLEEFMRELGPNSFVHLSPATPNLDEARRWLRTMGGGLDGIIAKRIDAAYEPGGRTGVMRKIKNMRTADCVVGGFRYGSKQKFAGSLLLGLYDEEGLLHHVGFSSSIKAAERAELTKKLEQVIQPPGFTGRAPGGPSRWSTERSTEWQPLAPKLVVEVQYDHFSGGRFRHGTKLLRWRPDKAPRQCTISQVAQESRSPLALLG